MVRDKLFVAVLFLAVVCVLVATGTSKKLWGADGDSVIVIFSGGVGSGGGVGADGGWVDDGTVIRLESVDDSVGIGTTSPTEKLEVDGSIKATGSITATTFTGDGSGLTGITEVPSTGILLSETYPNTTLEEAGFTAIITPGYPSEWTQATTSAGWSARYLHTSVVFDGKLWVIGGYNGSNGFNDVWYANVAPVPAMVGDYYLYQNP